MAGIESILAARLVVGAGALCLGMIWASDRDPIIKVVATCCIFTLAQLFESQSECSLLAQTLGASKKKRKISAYERGCRLYEEDPVRAIHYLTIAVNNGNAKAPYALGQIAEELGLVGQALRWYTLGIERGNHRATAAYYSLRDRLTNDH